MKTLKHILSIPFVWAPFIPVLIAHFFIFIFQAVCFRLYDIERVKFKDFISLDRGKLPYLTFVEKINCAYCSYANGVFMYMSEVAHRTEYYWCGIKHRNQRSNPAFAYQEKFAKYGDREAYKNVIKITRKKP